MYAPISATREYVHKNVLNNNNNCTFCQHLSVHSWTLQDIMNIDQSAFTHLLSTFVINFKLAFFLDCYYKLKMSGVFFQDWENCTEDLARGLCCFAYCHRLLHRVFGGVVSLCGPPHCSAALCGRDTSVRQLHPQAVSGCHIQWTFSACNCVLVESHGWCSTCVWSYYRHFA